jgi:hypothetical protein
MTELDFIAQGESFAMFISVADHLKLSRVLDKKHSALIRKRRNRMKVSYIVTVENLSTETAEFMLADRIPVSENREVKIENIKISQLSKPDSKGIIRWEVELKPGEKRQFRISYQVEYPEELVLEARRKHKMKRGSKSPASPARAYDFNEDMMKTQSALE